MDFSGKKLFLAPLAGVSDTVFRGLCRENGADVVMSEMISAEGLFYKSKATERLLCFGEQERPIGIQLFGANPDHLAAAADIVGTAARPDFIDLNSGCPVPKVVKKNGGASLLRDLRLFTKLLRALVAASPVPVSVKLRSGWNEHEWVDVEFARAAVDCGVKAVILHPRSKTMGFSGHSYWERIAVVKNAVRVPVIGNGDIVTEQDGCDMFSRTGCDSIMIGRGALGNPWLFSKIKCLMRGLPPDVVTPRRRLAAAAEHVRRYVDAYGEKKAVADLKKHVSWYIRGLPGASAVRTEVFHAQSLRRLEEILTKAF